MARSPFFLFFIFLVPQFSRCRHDQVWRPIRHLFFYFYFLFWYRNSLVVNIIKSGGPFAIFIFIFIFLVPQFSRCRHHQVWWPSRHRFLSALVSSSCRGSCVCLPAPCFFFHVHVFLSALLSLAYTIAY